MQTAVALGIDVGTTRIKAAAVSLDGHELQTASVYTPWHQSDQGPLLDLAELRDLVIKLCDGVATRAQEQGYLVASIAASSIAETGALLNGSGQPILPGFAWHHRSGNPERIYQALGEREFRRRTGRAASISPSITKLELISAGGHVFTPDQRWLNISDYVAFCLSGEQAMELSTSSRTGLLDIAAKTWWDDALEFLGASRSLLPGEPVPGGTVLGPVLADLPKSLHGAVVTTGGHDHPVAALGVGVSDPGWLCMSLGTAEAHLRFIEPISDRNRIEAIVDAGGFVDWHPLGDRLTVLGAAPTGITLERLAALLGFSKLEQRLVLSERAAVLTRPISTSARIAEPTFDSFNLVGIDDAVEPTAVWRQAVADLIEQSTATIEQIDRVLGVRKAAVVYGGWIHDPLVRRERLIQLGPTTTFASINEPGIVGAAMLSAKGSGLIDALPTFTVKQQIGGLPLLSEPFLAQSKSE